MCFNFQELLSEVPGKTLIEKLHNSWDHLQTEVNRVVDSDLDKLSTDKNMGIKQVLMSTIKLLGIIKARSIAKLIMTKDTVLTTGYQTRQCVLCQTPGYQTTVCATIQL